MIFILFLAPLVATTLTKGGWVDVLGVGVGENSVYPLYIPSIDNI